ncbi:MAG: hypothetical protein WC683_05445 [bacterium]
MNSRPIFLNGWQVIPGPRAEGYQSKENRKIEKRLFYNLSRKYLKSPLVVLEGGKSLTA